LQCQRRTPKPEVFPTRSKALFVPSRKVKKTIQSSLATRTQEFEQPYRTPPWVFRSRNPSPDVCMECMPVAQITPHRSRNLFSLEFNSQLKKKSWGFSIPFEANLGPKLCETMLTVITVTTIGMLSSAHRNIALKRIQENGMLGVMVWLRLAGPLQSAPAAPCYCV
jgi:hypothetical protein